MAEELKKKDAPKGMTAEMKKAEARKKEMSKELRNTPAGKGLK